MRVFWHNGALQLVPETEREGKLLAELSKNVKFGKPPGMQDRIPGGNTPSGDGLFELLVGDEKTRPSSNSGKLNHKQQILCINKLP